MADTVICVEGIGKLYRVGERESYQHLRHVLAKAVRGLLKTQRSRPKDSIWAVRDVSFAVTQGEVVGLIGRNGVGKSTLLKVLARVTRPTVGHAEIHGRIGSLLEVGTGFHMELTGRENIFMNGAILGMKKAEIARKFDEIVAFAEVERFLDSPLKHYSSGMQMRLAFAVAAHLEPEILLVDEVLAVGDIQFQKKCLGKMQEVSHTGRTIIFVSHQMNQIRRLCQRVLWADAGAIRMDGPTQQVVSAYESAMARGSAHAESADGDRQGQSAPAAKARFLRWEIVEAEADPHTLDWLGPVTLRVSLEIPRPITRGHYGIGLYNSERQLMWAWAIEPLRLEAGRHQISHTFPMLPLRPGLYAWLTALYDEGKLLDWWDCLPEMSVATENYQHHRDEWNGILNLPATFKVTPLDVPSVLANPDLTDLGVRSE